MAWMERTPPIVIDIAVFILLFAATEVGFLGYRWLKPEGGHRTGGHEFLGAAVLGLLALLLGFTFSLSLTRYDERRNLVVQEANAIDVAWLRVQLLDEPHRSELGSALKQYTDARVAWSEADSGGFGPTLALKEKVWTAVEHLARGGASPIVVRQVIDPLNEAFDTQAARTASRAARIPGEVLVILVLYSTLSMMLLGYITAIDGPRKVVAMVLLVLLLTLAFSVILDLDSPRNGWIMVPQQPLIDVRAAMR
jgi:hypothetical protein